MFPMNLYFLMQEVTNFNQFALACNYTDMFFWGNRVWCEQLFFTSWSLSSRGSIAAEVRQRGNHQLPLSFWLTTSDLILSFRSTIRIQMSPEAPTWQHLLTLANLNTALYTIMVPQQSNESCAQRFVYLRNWSYTYKKSWDHDRVLPPCSKLLKTTCHQLQISGFDHTVLNAPICSERPTCWQ